MLLAEWGIAPAAMLGHSLGEYVAAWLAGVFSLADALSLVAARGALMERLPAGAMLAVPLPEAELRPLLGAGLDLAAVNGPALAVASGPPEAIAELQAALGRRGLDGHVGRRRRQFERWPGGLDRFGGLNGFGDGLNRLGNIEWLANLNGLGNIERLANLNGLSNVERLANLLRFGNLDGLGGFDLNRRFLRRYRRQTKRRRG